MANTVPKVWQITQVLQDRLQEITVANGYRTDAGADVRLERSSDYPPAAPYLALGRINITRPSDTRSDNEREVEIVVEAHIPVSLVEARRRAEDISEDIEDALTAYLQMPLASPLKFQENGLLDRPDGMPVVVAQTLFTTRYRR